MPEAPKIIAIFGASGDLASIKLMPALKSLFSSGTPAGAFRVLGLGRTALGAAEWRERLKPSLGEAEDVEAFLSVLDYMPIDLAEPKAYAALAERLAAMRDGANADILFYLATPPSAYAAIARGLVGAGLNDEESGARRIVLEKPFGADLASARALNTQLHESWKEGQIFRIDHYLGKETVQNLLVFRFGNDIFESLWNHRFIDYVEISSAEDIGTGNRAAYFDQTGIVRDMVQNHLLQVLAMVALEAPASFAADAVRDETRKLLSCLRPWTPVSLGQDLVLGRYARGAYRGQEMRGYLEEAGVDPTSRTETFAALRAYVDNPRWAGVPFYLRVGKRLPFRVTEVSIHFKDSPIPAFGALPGRGNALVIRIQPDEGMILKVRVKRPGNGFQAANASMDFHYRDIDSALTDNSYRRLLDDALSGDATLFARSNAVEAAWKFIDPIIAFRDGPGARIIEYPAGSWGPAEADALLSREGRSWRFPCRNLGDEENYCSL